MGIVFFSFFNSNFLTITSLEGVFGHMCVKNPMIEAKKKMQYTNLERVGHLDANISRKKNIQANCLPLEAIFLAQMIKVYASPTALSRHQLS